MLREQKNVELSFCSYTSPFQKKTFLKKKIYCSFKHTIFLLTFEFFFEVHFCSKEVIVKLQMLYYAFLCNHIKILPSHIYANTKIKGLICCVNKKMWRYHFVATLPHFRKKLFLKKKPTAALSIQYFY